MHLASRGNDGGHYGRLNERGSGGETEQGHATLYTDVHGDELTRTRAFSKVPNDQKALLQSDAATLRAAATP